MVISKVQNRRVLKSKKGGVIEKKLSDKFECFKPNIDDQIEINKSCDRQLKWHKLVSYDKNFKCIVPNNNSCQEQKKWYDSVVINNETEFKYNPELSMSIEDQEYLFKILGKEDKTNLAKVMDYCSRDSHKHCNNNLGIARYNMPQVKPVDIDNISKKYNINSSKYTITKKKKIQFDDIKPTQREAQGMKIDGMAETLSNNVSLGDSPIYVSNDGYVIDGHHRYFAYKNDSTPKDEPLTIIEIDEPILDILQKLIAEGHDVADLMDQKYDTFRGGKNKRYSKKK